MKRITPCRAIGPAPTGRRLPVEPDRGTPGSVAKSPRRATAADPEGAIDEPAGP